MRPVLECQESLAADGRQRRELSRVHRLERRLAAVDREHQAFDARAGAIHLNGHELMLAQPAHALPLLDYRKCMVPGRRVDALGGDPSM